MNFRNIKLLSITILSIILFYGCSSSEQKTTANVKFTLVDAPGDYEQVNVEIIDIQYNSSEDEENWKSFKSFSGPVNVDLTTLIAGNSSVLSDEVIEADSLNEVRLILSDNNSILIEGEEQTRALSTPSAQQSGLKLKLNQELQPGFSYTFILDWDVQKSIVKAGNSDAYNLKPVIRVNLEANSAIIIGKIISDTDNNAATDQVVIENALVSLYNSNDEYVTETLTNENGEFSINGINSGDYVIKVMKEGFVDFETTTPISLTAGETKDIGEYSIVTQ